MFRCIRLMFLLLFPFYTLAQVRPDQSHQKIDVIVDTDLGGDPDDIQSLFRLIHYSDLLNIKGIISTPCTDIEDHPWDTIPQVKVIREWIRRVDPDQLRRNGYRQIIKEKKLLKQVYAGVQHPGSPANLRSTKGSRHIIQTARKYSAEQPLWILVWGSLTSVAQALHDDPSIASAIRIYYIGSTNTQHDSLSKNYVYRFMDEKFPGLWWIENGVMPKGSRETFRGVYQGGRQDGEWGNTGFVRENIRGHGSTHRGGFAEKCGDVFPVATSPAGSLKEGDSPSILYLISPLLGGPGDSNDPQQESWGGRFRKADPARFPNYYIDLDGTPAECQSTINKWREAFLGDWKKRWDRYHVKAGKTN